MGYHDTSPFAARDRPPGLRAPLGLTEEGGARRREISPVGGGRGSRGLQEHLVHSLVGETEVQKDARWLAQGPRGSPWQSEAQTWSSGPWRKVQVTT